MSYIVYDDNPSPRSGGKFNFADADATKFYMQHYSNRLLLQFIANNPLADFSEKQQANKELLICDRKLQFWMRHANFSQKAASEASSQLLREWSAK